MESHPLFIAESSDCARIARLQADFNAEFGSACPPVDVLARRLAAMLAGKHAFAVCAGTRTKITGHALVTLRPTIYSDGPLAVLDELYVIPKLRGHGIGSAMLEGTLAELHRRKAGEIHINVDEDDVDTRRFYRAHGFVNSEPGSQWKMLLYVKELGP